MKKKKIILGKILGIPVVLDHTWFLIFILITWALAESYFPHEYKNWSTLEYWLVSGVTSVLFFISILIHEFGHSFLAIHYKIKVRRITLFIFGGIAEIANEPKKPIEEFWIAIAGPITSFLLSLIFQLLSISYTNISPIHALFKYLALINFILAIFNLVPGFPLDGGRVLRSIIWYFTNDLEKSTKIAAAVGRFFGFMFILLGFIQIMTGDVGNGIWTAFIGWFLETAAMSQVLTQKIPKLLEGHTVYEAMTKSYGIVPDDMTLQELADDEILSRARRFFIVRENGVLNGLLTIHVFKDIPKNQWGNTKVVDKMIPFSKIKKADINTPLTDILKEMDEDGVNQLPVFDEGELTGIISRKGIISFISSLHYNKK